MTAATATAPAHSGSLAGRHALVTGGGTGIGAAIAAALLAVGARVTIAGRRAEVLQTTRSALASPLAHAIVMDVTAPDSVASAVRASEAHHGSIDILVNNAGRAASAPFLKATPAMLTDMLAVNLLGVWHVTHAVLPQMLAQRFGRIITIASTAGLIGYPYVTAYVAAKHAVVGLTRALALEVARDGITVNAVCPGFTETPLLDGAIETIVAKTGRSRDSARAELARGNPTGRLVAPEEVAATVAWLASPAAAMINGQAIAVCGGEVMTG